MSKEVAVIFGNCQAAAIQTILADHEGFTDRFDIAQTRPVHVLDMDERDSLLKNASKAGLVIHQPVSSVYQPASTERLVAAMHPSAKSITFPVAWFDGYFPDMAYLKSAGAKTSTGLFDYHSRVILSAFTAGNSVAEAARAYLCPDLYDIECLEETVDRNIREMEVRESTLDIKLSKLFAGSFRDKCLFFTINHPTGHVLYYVIDEMLKQLGIAALPEHVKKKHVKILGGLRWMASPSVYSVLRFPFAGQPHFTSRGKNLSLEDAVGHYFHFYEGNPALVEANLSIGLNGARIPAPQANA